MSYLRRQWNDTCLGAGLPSLSLDTAAKIMAVLLHYCNTPPLWAKQMMKEMYNIDVF